ncbi:MAG: DMT family transporter [Eubacteriales bacterium]|nr:DMT family transporter [Eubacteriales bacterium]
MEKKGIISAVASAMLYGTNPVLVTMTVEAGVTSSGLLFGRTLLCVLLLTMYLAVGNRLKDVNIKAAAVYMLIGGAFYSSQAFMYLRSLRLNSVSVATILFCMYPVYVPLFAQLIGREKITAKTPICLALVLAGLWLLIGVTPDLFSISGFGAGIMSGLLYSMHIVCGDYAESKGFEMRSEEKTLFLMLGACIICGTVGAVSSDLYFGNNIKGVIGIASMGTMCTTLPMLLFWRSVGIIGAVRASIISILEPVTSAILSAVLLGERLTRVQILGMVIVLFAVALSQLRAKTGK